MPRFAILGASGGIGSALARRLTASGNGVLLAGRDAARLTPLAAELSQRHVEVQYDNSAMLERVLLEASETHGRFDGLACCVGSLVLKPAHATSDEEFRATIETNLFSAFAAVKAASRILRDGGGSVVLFASAAAEIGIANHEAIAAAKAGVIGLTRSAAATYAGMNIRFNAIAPGLVRTPLTRRIWDSALAASASKDMHALGRLGEPEQAASLAAWLLDPDNDWMTGQVISLDGGLSKVLAKRK